MFVRFVRKNSFRTLRFFSSVPLPQEIPPTNLNPTVSAAQAPTAAADLKFSVFKRAPKKKRTVFDHRAETLLKVSAFATADWYDLDRLKENISAESDRFQLISIPHVVNDVLCLQINSKSESKMTSEAFIFDDGAIVFWNVEPQDEECLLNQVKLQKRFLRAPKLFLRCFFFSFSVEEISENRYPNELIQNEKEIMKFTEAPMPSTLLSDVIRLNSYSKNEQLLDKYTFSNALALSVKLGEQFERPVDVKQIRVDTNKYHRFSALTKLNETNTFRCQPMNGK